MDPRKLNVYTKKSLSALMGIVLCITMTESNQTMSIVMNKARSYQ